MNASSPAKPASTGRSCINGHPSQDARSGKKAIGYLERQHSRGAHVLTVDVGMGVIAAGRSPNNGDRSG